MNFSNFQNDSELFGRTLKVNLAKPLRLKENSSRPVWADDEWLQKYSGQTLNKGDPAAGADMEAKETKGEQGEKRQAEEAAEVRHIVVG